MSTVPPRSTVDDADARPVGDLRPVDLVLVEAVRAMGLAFMMAGVLGLVIVALDAVLRRPEFINTPLDVVHRVAGGLFAALGALVTAFTEDEWTGLRRFGWLEGAIRLDPNFLHGMILVHLNLAALNLAIGYGLRRLRPWARRLAIGVTATAAVLAAVHVAVLLVRHPTRFVVVDLFEAPRIVRDVLVASAVVAALTPALLWPRRVAALFVPGAVARVRAHSGPRRGILLGKLLSALLMGAAALGIQVLLVLGPLAEVVGLVAWLCRGY